MRVLDDEDKTVARLHVDTAAGDDVTTARLTVSPLRGYDREAGRAGALLASVNGVTSAAASYYEQSLAAAGTSFDGARLARPGAAITADMPAAAAIAARAPDVPRHRRGQRAGRARRHRHRVPPRPAGRGPSRPFDREAGRRHPAGASAHVGGPPSAVERLAADLKWLGDATTPTRDLDVYLLGVPGMAERLRAARPPDLDAFRAHLAGYRAEAFARLTADLRSPRFATLVGPVAGGVVARRRATRRPARRRSSSARPGCAAPTAA